MHRRVRTIIEYPILNQLTVDTAVVGMVDLLCHQAVEFRVDAGTWVGTIDVEGGWLNWLRSRQRRVTDPRDRENLVRGKNSLVEAYIVDGRVYPIHIGVIRLRGAGSGGPMRRSGRQAVCVSRQHSIHINRGGLLGGIVDSDYVVPSANRRRYAGVGVYGGTGSCSRAKRLGKGKRVGVAALLQEEGGLKTGGFANEGLKDA